MSEVTIRELRHHGGQVLQRVAAGEPLVVTRDGDPIAELRPLPRSPLKAAELRRRWRSLPAIDPQELRDDIDAVLDPSL
jgi:prevent-host-death family protein